VSMQGCVKCEAGRHKPQFFLSLKKLAFGIGETLEAVV